MRLNVIIFQKIMFTVTTLRTSNLPKYENVRKEKTFCSLNLE